MRIILKIILLSASVWTISPFIPYGRAEVTLTTLVTFDGTNGYLPEAGLMQGKDGNFYGTLGYGGWYDLGVVYRMTPNGKCIILVTFDGENGSHPDGLIQGKDGNFYGTTLQGGPVGNGSIFKMTPDGTITTLATFGYDNGYGPWGLVQGRDGNLYGRMSQFRGQSTFEVTLGSKLIIPATNDMPADSGGSLKAKDGNSYGTTFSGRGDNSNGFGLGTVFRISPDGARTNLIVFNGTNGANPLSDLVQGRDGNIYGITTRGGIFNQGTIFRVNLTKTSSPIPTNINIPILIHPPAGRVDLHALELIEHSIKSNGKIASNSSNGISGTNRAFERTLEYVLEVRQTRQRPLKLPDGVTIADITNASYMVSVWSMTTPPRPISFYGKVVDENDQPVAGATAHFVWDVGVTSNIPRPFTDTGKKSADITTDSAGLFSLTNVMGTELDVSIGKAGYYSSRTNRGTQYFKYSKMNLDSFYGIGDYFKPDSNHPVIYYLHRKGQGAELITSENGIRPNLAIRIPKDGTSVHVDFFQKQASATGQLEINQNKPPWQGATNWSFHMSIPDGGLVENQDEFQFEAPESGYQPTVGYDFTKGETNWTTHAIKQFYITFGQPRKYGWLRIESDIAQETIFLTYAINPTGSRNLEPAN